MFSSVARSRRSTTWASVSAITQDRVIREGFYDPASAYQHTVPGIVVDLALSDLDDRSTAACVTRTDAVAAVIGNLAVPYASDRYTSCGVGENSVSCIGSEDRAVNGTLRSRSCVKSICVTGEPAIVNGVLDRTTRTEEVNSVEGVVSDDAISDMQIQVVGFVDSNSITGIKAEDHAVFHINGLGLEYVDPVNAVTESVNR